MKYSIPTAANDPAVAAYVKLIRTAEALHAEVTRGLTAEGLTASQFSTLKVLRMRGPLPQRDIANYLLKTGANVTMVVDNLESRELVKRTRDTADRRIVTVSLTPEGERLFDLVYPPHLERIRLAMKGLDEEGCGDLTSLLSQLHTTIAEPLCVATGTEEPLVLRTAS
ncbi:MarR family winged helix-turn-helix transcriptional regulator [Fimbriimonas ginsengisoli]|uniref:Transcriptional regulator, MarR family n=1 Tax=Fimbriimonas ginsengisoli Gsoil 348 TaxID=661478 RepID=A0A068NRX7_FIMGI|nr:MarR family transcriptional regulator [Fimbriimonas ginsengisoli]AIE86072.1 Transcriptional regulator, MarR family [Fimbriimonas ginsengisoli Gsoil 348]